MFVIKCFQCATAAALLHLRLVPNQHRLSAGSWCPTGPSAEGAAGKCQPQL